MDLAKAYTTSTASVHVPVTLRFTCPGCGKPSIVNKAVLLSSQATVRGYSPNAARASAQQNLASSAEGQLNTLIRSLEQGDMRVLLDPSGKNISGKVLCTHCGLRQIADIPGKRRTLYPRGFAWIMIGLICAILFVFAFVVARLSQSGSTTVSPALVSAFELLCIAVVVAVIAVNRIRSGKAYSDPALLAKRYRSVLNPHMEAVLIPGAGSVIHVDIPGKKQSGT